MRPSWNSKLFGVLYALALVGFTGYAALDTFVIPHAYAAVEPSSSASDSGETADTGTDGQTQQAAEGETNANTDTDTDTDTDTAQTDSAQDQSGSGTHKKRPDGSGHHGKGGPRSGGKGGGKNGGKNGGSAQSGSESETASNSTASEAGDKKTYSQDGLNITVTTYRENDTNIYVADVQAASADALQSAFASDTYGRNITAKTSEIAQSAGAVLAINGDFYGSQSSGYVIRNGVLYRDTSAGREDLVIWKDGSFSVIHEDEVTAQELVDQGAQQVLSFGPALVTDGNLSVSEGEEVGKAMASNPRTAIGVVDDLHYLFVVADGRTSDSTGLSLSQLAEFMQGLGVQTAYNLDGGGSSVLYFQGEVLNQPTTNGNRISERSVSDIVYVK